MGVQYQRLIIAISLLFITVNIISAQTTIDTLFKSNNEIFELEAVGNRLAWRTEIEGEMSIVLMENNQFDTLTPPTGTTIQDYILTETIVAWDAKNLNAPQSGPCNQFVLYSLVNINGTTQTISVECPDTHFGRSDFYVRCYKDNIKLFDIIDNSNQVIFTMPRNYQGYTFTDSQLMSNGNRILYFVGFIEGEYVIFKFDIQTLDLDLIFTSSCIIDMDNQNMDDNVAFYEYGCGQTVNVYLYMNGTIHSIDNVNTNLPIIVVAFRNGVFYLDRDNSNMWTYYHNGVTELFPGAVSDATTSQCYIGWKSNISSNAGPSGLAYTLFNGFESEQIFINGISNSTQGRITLIGNQLYTIVEDGTFNILRINFDLPCYRCTDEDITTNTEENYISKTFIQSTTSFTTNTDIYYRAEDYINLNDGFQIPKHFVFEAEIDDCQE